MKVLRHLCACGLHHYLPKFIGLRLIIFFLFLLLRFELDLFQELFSLVKFTHLLFLTIWKKKLRTTDAFQNKFKTISCFYFIESVKPWLLLRKTVENRANTPHLTKRPQSLFAERQCLIKQHSGLETGSWWSFEQGFQPQLLQGFSNKSLKLLLLRALPNICPFSCNSEICTSNKYLVGLCYLWKKQIRSWTRGIWVGRCVKDCNLQCRFLETILKRIQL